MRRRTLVALFGLSVARVAWAQMPAPPPVPAPPTVGFQDSFFLQSANGDNRLVLGMVAQTDGRFSPDDLKPITNTFAIRKIRPTFTSRLAASPNTCGRPNASRVRPRSPT